MPIASSGDSRAPVVDPRTFQDIVDEAKRRIPQYCPEWTDHNVSDPGVTLIELFAWMTEVILYRLNKVPERHYLKFLELIDVHLRPAVAASAEITLWLTAPVQQARVIPRGIEIATRQTETRSAITFTTSANFTILVPKLAYWLLASRNRGRRPPNDYSYRDVTDRLDRPDAGLVVFPNVPNVGDTFYLGFTENLGGHVLQLTIRCSEALGYGIDQNDPPLTWEYWDGDSWHRLMPSSEEVDLLIQREPEVAKIGNRLDETRGLNNDGRVILVIPRNCAMRDISVEGQRLNACWVRCRADRVRPDQPFYERSPVVNGFSTDCIGGTVVAHHSFQVTGEVLGRSDGTPSQTFSLHYTPVLPRRTEGDAPERVEVQRADGIYEPWNEVEYFSDSDPTTSHYTLNSVSGEIRFGPRVRDGDGTEKQFGRLPPKGRQIRFSTYRSGGGTIGNVGRGTLSVPKSSSELAYVKWVANLRAATGGRDQETLDELMLRGPKLIRTREVAITRADFEDVVRQASTEVAQVRCVSTPTDPTLNGTSPRYVRLLVVPTAPASDDFVSRSDLEPTESAMFDLTRRIRAYLSERTPLTTDLTIELADYRWVSVLAKLVVRQSAGLDEVARERTRRAVQAEALRRLYRLIHPAAGGPDGQGWPFGRSLTLGDVYPLLESVPGVLYVDEVRFRVVTLRDGVRRLGSEERLIRLSDSEVLCSDVHDVFVQDDGEPGKATAQWQTPRSTRV